MFSGLWFKLQAMALMAGLPTAVEKTERKPVKVYPRSSDGETARRARQITKGQLTQSNGLVWPGQLISRPDGKLYLRRPFAR